jgi:excisionase family DNA binding protein
MDTPPPDLVRVLLEPQRIVRLEAADVPALLGDLERVRAALWNRLIGGSRVETPAPVQDVAGEVLTVPEVARELRFTRAYVYEAVRRGDVAAVRKGKYVRIQRTDLRAWLEGRPVKGLDRMPRDADSSRHAPLRVGPRSRARTGAGVSARIHASTQVTAPPGGNAGP